MRAAARRAQGGQTLVELLVGLAVASVIVGALGGVLFTVSDQFSRWGDRIQAATQGFELAADLQADGHRYVLCSGAAAAMPPRGLTFCRLTDCSPVATYSSQAQGGGFAVVRTVGGRAALVERATGTPSFNVPSAGSTLILSVDGVRAGGPVVVYAVPPSEGDCP
jgi:hypothetical protein